MPRGRDAVWRFPDLDALALAPGRVTLHYSGAK